MNRIIVLTIFLLAFINAQGKPTNLQQHKIKRPHPNTETDSWQYWKTAHADFDGDGQIERVEILAQSQLMKAKRELSDRNFSWDDGQRWVVRFIEKQGDTTWAYSKFLQSGSIDGYLSQTEPPSIYLVIPSHSTISAYEVFYFGPDSINIVEQVRAKWDSKFQLNHRENKNYWPKIER